MVARLLDTAAPAPVPPVPTLVDGQGRAVSYLRLSITEACNYRCRYCSPPAPEARRPTLAADELERLVSLLSRLGIRRVRLTGGEPLLRPDVVEIASRLARLPGIAEVAVTTNGHRLASLAGPLFRAGARQLNVSLDSLDAATFARVSGGGELGPVLEGLEACAAAGFRRVKLNTVLLRGINDAEAPALVRYAWARGLLPRFIECMPFRDGAPVKTSELLDQLAAAGLPLTREPRAAATSAVPAGPCEYWRGEGGLVGFVSPLSRNFCSSCNRLRLSSDGRLYTCLGSAESLPLGARLREGADDAALEAAIRDAVQCKPARHAMAESAVRPCLGPMMSIGG